MLPRPLWSQLLRTKPIQGQKLPARFLRRRFQSTETPLPSSPRQPSKITRYILRAGVFGLGVSTVYFGFIDGSIFDPVLRTLGLLPQNEGGSQRTFTPFTLVDKVPVSSTSSIFHFRPETPLESPWDAGIWSVDIKQPQLQIARAYTPIPLSLNGKAATPGNDDLSILIRQETQGEVSGWLHRLPLGANIDIGTPKLEFRIPKGLDEIIFLAGGTGIAPALQVASLLASDAAKGENIPKFTLLWANRKREDCVTRSTSKPSSSWLPWSSSQDIVPPKHEAFGVQHYLTDDIEKIAAPLKDKFSIQYFIDEERNYIARRNLRACLQSGDSREAKKLVLVSGPDGFVSYLAGPKIWMGGKQLQGPIDGILAQISPGNWSVWKL